MENREENKVLKKKSIYQNNLITDQKVAEKLQDRPKGKTIDQSNKAKLISFFYSTEHFMDLISYRAIRCYKYG